MKAKLSRFMSFICLTTLILCSGCSSSDNKGLEQSVTEKPYEIVIELLATAPNTDLETVEAEVNKITLKEINCTVKFREVMIDKHKTELNRLSAKNRMDIIVCGITTTPFELKNSGILLGLNDFLVTYGSDLYKKCGSLMDACYINDNYYFIPGSLYPALQNSIIYNEDLLQKYNITPPVFQTDSYTTISCFFSSVKQSEYPSYASSAGDGFTMSIPEHTLESFGDNNNYSYGVFMDFDTESQIVNIYETEEFYQYCKMMQQWYNDGYLKEDSLINGQNLFDDLNNEEIMCAILPYGIESFSHSSASDNTYQYLPLNDTVLTESSVAYQSLGITTFSEQPEKCMEFLNLLYTNSELSNLINYGIENVHYVKESEHIIAYPEGVTNSSSSYGNIIHFGDAKLNYMHAPFTEQDYEKIEQYSPAYAVTSSAFGYTFHTEKVNKQISAVNQVINEYRPGLICGITDIDDLLPKFIAALKDAGIDEIITENQRQFDQWKSKHSPLTTRSPAHAA